MYSEDETKRSALERVDRGREAVDPIPRTVLVADKRLKHEESPTFIRLCDHGHVPNGLLQKRLLRPADVYSSL